MWWREVCDMSAALMSQVPCGGPQLAAMCVSGRGVPCLVFVRRRATGPLRPAILYGVDTRATAGKSLRWTDELGERRDP